MFHRLRIRAGAALLFALAGAHPVAAQSVTAGALKGTVRAADGSLLAGAAVTVETPGGGTLRNLESREDGSFQIRVLLPGTYHVLVELEGFQPIRLRGVIIGAGRTTTVTAVLTERPPPITSVTEVDQPGIASGSLGRIVSGTSMTTLDRRFDATDAFRDQSEVVQSMDGRAGFAVAALGLAARWSRLFVDGVPEQLLRHPGLPGEPASAPLFAREAIDQAQLTAGAVDAEWRGVSGPLIGLQTRRGDNRLRFAPFVTWSGSSVGGKPLDNPADSSAGSFQFGASVSGAFKPDTAHFFLGGSYQSLEMPSAWAWERDTSRYLGQAVSLRETIPQIGTDKFGSELRSSVAPAIRSWKGGTAAGRIDWQLSSRSAFVLRAGFASFKETNPSLGRYPGNDAGTSLTGRDLTLAASILTTGTVYSNEVRAGLSSASRDWKRTGPPSVELIGDNVRFGANPALPALFETRTVSLSEAARYDRGRHSVKGGITLDYTNYRQRYQYGAGAIYQFGDLDRFGAATGAFFQSASDAPEVKFSMVSPALFLQDSYEVSTGLRLLFGVRWETQVLPRNKITLNRNWADLSGIATDSVFADRRGIQPRVGFVLDPGNRGVWVLQGDLGLYADGIDPAAFAEAIGHDGSVEINRRVGSLSGWPNPPAASEAGVRLTLLRGDENHRAPRTLKGAMGLAGALAGGLTLRVAGSYRHTDFLLRRNDLNRNAAASASTQEGRPVYGTLVQQGALVTSAVGSSRRFSSFDLVSALTPTGFSDHYELTASLERQVSGPLSLAASYTASRTRDNLVGLLQADPADQLSPFPGGVDGADWDTGRSDLDVPHRLTAMAEYHGTGRIPITLAVRGRWRSGLPFTPGFSSGVDVNGDLGGNNDPVTADAVGSLDGSEVMATCDGSAVAIYTARNSCRDRGVGSLDVRFSIGLPVGGGARVALTVDGFNIVASSTGIVDHAAVIIDPARSIAAANDVLTLPFLANPRFGTLLSRRTEPRLIRFGLRMEY